MRRASVVVPTHSSSSTLDLAVGSAQHQTVEDIEIVIMGDGVTDEVRQVAGDLADRDARIRFLDLPKGAHHGEVHRDRVVREQLDSPIVCYLCDDDLLLPDHVETMAGLLAEADLANSLNGHLDAAGRFVPAFSDLASEEHRRWLMHPHRNSVSVTGTAHTVEVYRRVPVGWEPPPPGRWTDHLMWQKLLALPGLRAVTADRVTALQFPTHLDDRAGWTSAQRRAELERWQQVLLAPDGPGELDRRVRWGLNHDGAQLRHALTGCHDHVEDVRADRDRIEEERERTERERVQALAEVSQLRIRTGELEHRLGLIEGSRVWRARSSLVRGPLRNLVRGQRGGDTDRR